MQLRTYLTYSLSQHVNKYPDTDYRYVDCYFLASRYNIYKCKMSVSVGCSFIRSSTLREELLLLLYYSTPRNIAVVVVKLIVIVVVVARWV